MTDAERAAYAELLERQAAPWMPLAALSLSYNVPVSAARIRHDLSALHTHVDRRVLGRRFYKRRPEERSQFWAVIEGLASADGVIGAVHRHCHCAWKMPPGFNTDDLSHILDDGLWLRFAIHGSHNVQDYYFGWGGYATKFMVESDAIIESIDFLRPAAS